MTAVLTLFWADSCTGEKENSGAGHVALQIDRKALEFGSGEGSGSVTVTSSVKVYTVPGADWVSTSGTPAGENKVAVTVSVKANTGAEARQTRISVVAGEEKDYIEVRQAAYTAPGPEPDPVPGDNAAWKMARRLGMGWNLGNQMDSHINGVASETAWGNKAATQALFDKLKEYGYKSVRIPVSWMGHIGEAPDYTIEKEWLDRVAEIVGYAEKAGLNAIINIHHDGADSKYWLSIKDAASSDEKAAQIMSEFTAVWKQIAERFADKGDFLIFESMNEIHDGGWGWGGNRNDGGKQYRILNEWNAAFVSTVRATGGNNASRALGVQGYCANPEYVMDNLVIPYDNNVMVSVHYYDPGEYTLNAKYSEWGHTADPAKAVPGSGENAVKTLFRKLYDKFIRAGIPVYIGEMGCCNAGDDRAAQFQRYYFEYVVKAAKTYGMGTFVWDNGAEGLGEETHGFINHSTGAFCSKRAESAVKAMVNAMNNEDPEYTLRTVYTNAPE